MRIFLTGATGYVGSAVLDALLRAGGDVTALVRGRGHAERVSPYGVKTVLGDLSDPASYADAARACDVFVHTAFERSKRGAALDRLVTGMMLDVAADRSAAGHPTSLVYTSDAWVLGDTQGRATEEWPLNPTPHVAWRPEHEQLVLAAASERVRAVVVRPGMVYGGARGIIGDLIKDSANGLVRVVGTGRNHWSCIYDRDLADLYARLALDSTASGVFHATDEADERADDIVGAIANHARMRPDIRHVPLSEARTKMGAIADALALDQIVRSARARALGWAPTLHSVSRNVARLFEEFRTAREAA